jgi:hypothetical protein
MAIDIVVEAHALSHLRRVAQAVATAVNGRSAGAVAAAVATGALSALRSCPVACGVTRSTHCTRRTIPVTIDIVVEAVALLQLRRIAHTVATAIH